MTFFQKTLLGGILLCSLNAFAQEQPTQPPFSGLISGNIIDSETKKPLEFAAISIYTYADSLITGSISDDMGDFQLKKIPAGNYYAKISFMGYITRRVDSLNISPETPMKNMGKIALVADAQTQEAVEIKGEKSLLQLGLDKKVFNVEKSDLANVENATEVLRGTPGVVVDKDDAVKVRNKTVSVYINGKPTGLSGENQTAILRQIPANTIKSIEILTNPSAKNAPDGGGSGIINIVLKKNTLVGFTGTVNAGMGSNAQAFRKENPQGPWFNKYNGGLSLNYKSNKINIFSNINANNSGYFSSSSSYRQNIYSDTTYFFNTYNLNTSLHRSLWGRLGTDIYLNDFNTLSFNVNASPSRGGSQGLRTYDNFDKDSILSYIDDRITNNDNNYNNMTYSAIYSIVFPQKDSAGNPILDNIGQMGENKELVFDLQFNDNKSGSYNHFYNQHFDANRQLLNNVLDSQMTRNLDRSYSANFKCDYTHPMPKKEQKLQLGYHFNFRKDKTDFLYQYYSNSLGEMLNDTTRSNIFDYTQQIHALYGTFSHKWSEKWSAEYGLRLEQAFVRPYLYNSNQAYPWSYFGIFPTVNIAFAMNDAQQLSFNFGRYVNRPWIWDVNPFPSFDDPRYLNYGNPYLRPSYSNNLSVEHGFYFGQNTLSSSLYASYSTGEWDEILYYDANTGQTNSTSKNLGKSYNAGIDLNGNFTLTSWWTINASASVYYNKYDASKVDSSLSYSTWGGYANAYSSMRFKFGLSISLGFNTWYAARDIQGKTIPNVWQWLSFSQTFLKQKLRIGLSLQNPFAINRYRFYSSTPYYESYSTSTWENRSVRLSVSYNFGKTNVKKQRASRVEQRAGGESGGGGGGKK